MSQLGVSRFVALVAGFVVTGIAARAADLQPERYALADPAAFRQAVPLAHATPLKAAAVRTPKKKPKPRSPLILTGLQNFRMPAQRALDRLGRPAGECQPLRSDCPVAFREYSTKSQSWQHATGISKSPVEAEESIRDIPAAGQSMLTRPFTDVPGFVPGRESTYEFTLKMPTGRDESVRLQAHLRRNAYNTIDVSDSTLRADWSLRF